MLDVQVRCAIYTRVSVASPYETEFTSIDAQRDICSSFIRSQQHKNWLECPTRYDDKGYSGSSTQRPGLTQLLHDIEEGYVDVVVIYKIDRLTRSLRDFFDLNETFKHCGVSVVSITQQFDTSDTLGRMVMNILMTFAQFEREMIADRIRDRRVAAIRGGYFQGGFVPLGFRVYRRRIYQHPPEAEIVRHIFRSFIKNPSYSEVARQLNEEGTPRRFPLKNQRTTLAGSRFFPGTIKYILGNELYRTGTNPEGSKVMDPRCAPIIDQATWALAQRKQLECKVLRVDPENSGFLLSGLTYDFIGRTMACRNASNGNRYYKAPRLIKAPGNYVPAVCVDAEALEDLIKAMLINVLTHESELRPLLLKAGVHASDLDALTRSGVKIGDYLAQATARKARRLLTGLIGRIEIAPELVSIVIRSRQVERFLRWRSAAMFCADRPFGQAREVTELVSTPICLGRVRVKASPPRFDTSAVGRSDPLLIKLLDDVQEAFRLMETDGMTISDVTKQMRSRTKTSISRLIRLKYLAPDIVVAIRRGTHPPDLTRKKLLRNSLPLDWNLQRQMLGFPVPDDVDLDTACFWFLR